MSAPAPAVPPIKMRPSTAPAAGKGERPLITPRNKKASRSLFRELQGTCDTMAHSKKKLKKQTKEEMTVDAQTGV